MHLAVLGLTEVVEHLGQVEVSLGFAFVADEDGQAFVGAAGPGECEAQVAAVRAVFGVEFGRLGEVFDGRRPFLGAGEVMPRVNQIDASSGATLRAVS